MPDWKFGDVLTEKGVSAHYYEVMVIGLNVGPPFTAGDSYEIYTGEWVGFTLSTRAKTAFPLGKTTWIPATWDWEKVK